MPNSVEKTMMILRVLSDARGENVTLERLSDVTGINKSTICHILNVLCRQGYARRVSHSDGYTTGPELYMLTRYGMYGGITLNSHPVLEHLYERYGGTAVLAVLGEGKKYIVDRACDGFVYSDRDAAILDDELYRTVTGRVLIASLPLDKALELYSLLGAPKQDEWSEATDRAGFIREISAIARLDCYRILRKQSDDSIWLSFASPVRVNGRCFGAVGLATRYSSKESIPCNEETAKMQRFFLKCRRELERRLSFK